MKKRNLTGQRFGKLTVLFEKGRDKQGRCLWECICDCGNTRTSKSWSLVSGDLKSCGCLWHPKKENHPSYLHGMTKTRFYQIWFDMKRRGTGKQKKEYYFDRGITISDNWLKFENFKTDMYEEYLKHSLIYTEKDTTIERVNNNKGYSKENCKWATMKEQTRNFRRNKKFIFNGEAICLQDLAKKYGFSREGLRKRLSKGWPIEKALFYPKQKNQFK